MALKNSELVYEYKTWSLTRREEQRLTTQCGEEYRKEINRWGLKKIM
jgi:hypothetical protein